MRQEKVLLTFETTTAAMAMEHICKQEGVTGRLIPIPSSIHAGCGMAWAASPEAESELMELAKQHDIVVSGVYLRMI